MSGPELPRPLSAGAALPVAPTDAALDTPAVLVDLDIAEANIRQMAEFAARNGFAVRPHIKTHKSVAMARRQLDAGAVGICAATVTEAEAMIRGGVGDVLIAYPLVGARKFERLAPLFAHAHITLAADSPAVIASYADLAARIRQRVPVLLEIDTGMHRVGVAPDQAVALALSIARAEGLAFRGIMTHAGHAHDVTALDRIAAVARQEVETMGAVRADLERAGLHVEIVSAGSAITARYFRRGDAVTEIRPGTYIYNDLRTLALAACTPDSLAATMLASVVSVDGDRVTIDAGNKTLTLSQEGGVGHGLIVRAPLARFTRLSEEHGVLNVPGGAERLAVGERVQVVPVHVCVWMDLQPEVYGLRGGRIVERIAIDAMRHSL